MNRSAIAALLGLALAWSAAAQGGAGPGGEVGLIKGQVTDFAGQPLGGATIIVIPATSSAALPDIAANASGAFELRVAPGRYYVMAEAKGCRSAAHGQREGVTDGLPITVDPRQPASVNLRLAKLATVEGRVIGPNGKPWEAADVALSQYTRSAAGPTLVSKLWASSGIKGLFRIADIPPGRYYLSATYRHSALPAGVAMPPRYYPDTDQIDQATPLITQPGADLAVNLQLRQDRAYVLTGLVTGVDGSPAPNVRLTATRYPYPERPRSLDLEPTRSKPDGTFAFTNFASGRYLISASDPQHRTAVVEIDIADRDVSNIKLMLGEGAKLSGRIIVEGEDARNLSRLKLEIVGAARQPARATVQPAGTFQFSAIPEGYGILLAGAD